MCLPPGCEDGSSPQEINCSEDLRGSQALHESVLHEDYPMPKVDETFAQLAGGVVFSKLDANIGFWQIPLAKESWLPMMFITPFGQCYLNKLPFWISSAPELFQERMSEVLERLDGGVCQIDDSWCSGQTKGNNYDACLLAVIELIKADGITELQEV